MTSERHVLVSEKNQPFANRSSLKYHLKNAHGLDDTALLPYLPTLPTKDVRVEQGCYMPDCSSMMQSWPGHLNHLESVHRMSAEDAKTSLEKHATFTQVMLPGKVGPQTAPSGELPASQPSSRKQ